MSTLGLTERDQSSIWHPYTQHGLQGAPLAVTSARGATLKLSDGAEVIDAISSWWVNIHGHGHPAIREAIARQFERLDHVMFAGFTHEPAVELAEWLLKLARAGGASSSRVFYSDNGSTAVEAALKIAFQFHVNQGRAGRTKFLALKGSYHGDTLGAMAVSEPEGFHRLFRPILAQVDFVEPDDLEGLEQRFAQDGSSYAAFIFEPLIQGAAGMRTYSPEFLKQAVQLCEKHSVLSIADEVFTGFFRAGTCFAFQQAGINPDLICLSKGLSGGVLPLAATLIREEIFEAFRSSEMRKAFLHGHSFTANPIACASGLASLNLLMEDATQKRIQAISKKVRESLCGLESRFQNHPHAPKVRCLGTIGAIERSGTGDYFSGSPDEMFRKAVKMGVLLRPLGRVLYAVPPYCVTDDEIDKIYRVMAELIGAN
jgi:adenosylmethionine---8-amino-7-oxononanoate aminotransferase